MDPEDYPSDSDASDEDFRPDKVEDDSASEVDSDENVEGHDAEDDGEESGGGRKRKQKTKKTGNKKAKIEKAKVEEKKESAVGENCQDDEDEEQLTDALWADFLAGTGNSNGSTASDSKTSVPAKKEPPRKSTEPKKVISEPDKVTTVTKIFEFAGEAVEVIEEVPKTNPAAGQSAKPAVKPALGSSNGNAGPAKPFGCGRPAGGGLGAVLGQIGKKNKLSTLEKTKLDWNSFKRSQGIEEELQTHNKGKDGYLERQDFLQRADVRQFEIEKSFRQTTRSNR